MTDYGHPLMFGSFLTPTGSDPERPVALAQLSEVAGDPRRCSAPAA